MVRPGPKEWPSLGSIEPEPSSRRIWGCSIASRAASRHLSPAKEAAKCHLRAQTRACIPVPSDHTHSLALWRRLPKAHLQSCPAKPLPTTHLCTPAAHVLWTRRFHAELHRVTRVPPFGLSRRNTRAQGGRLLLISSSIYLLQTPAVIHSSLLQTYAEPLPRD